MKKKTERKIKSKAERGTVVSYFNGVAKLKGLSHVFLHEILLDKRGKRAAFVIGFDDRFVETLFFDENPDLKAPLYRSAELFSVPISDGIIGRIIDGIGRSRDNLGPVRGEGKPVFRSAPPIIERAPVTDFLGTGVKVIDTALTLGKGQRELIIGDRKLGKSTLALDIVLNQKMSNPEVHCVYVLCGQKEQKLKEIISLFEKHNAFLYTTIVAATAKDSYAAQYLAPFVGCAIGEYFRDKKQHALIIYDDLSKHAKAYRSISLLLERVPGRESYPGDIFSLHAGLLERAANMSKKKGGGSLTAIPMIETQEGDITSFIPTNIISITDGQIYLERGLFQKGFLPAVNVGLSVSRVGSQAQPPALQKVVSGIRLTLSQHKELQKLMQLETALSEQAESRIHRGQLILELLKQEKHTNISWPEQVVCFYAVQNGLFDDIEESEWKDFEELLLQLMRTRYIDVLDKIEEGNFNKAIEKKIEKIVKDSKEEFLSG